jgi:mono/diheme cytochrome c family protein
MVSMQRPMIVLGGVLFGVMACADGESSEREAAASGRRDAATVASSPPLPGFSADVPAGRIYTPGATPPGPAVAAGSGGASTAASVPAGGGATPAGASTTGTPTGSPTGTPTGSPTGTPGAGTGGTASPKSALTLAAGEISAATGVFTTAQANRGREVYTNSCANCHMASAHTGGTFASNWHGKRVADLFDLLHNTMPVDAPGSLTQQQYADVVAYMLQLNGHPTGATELKPDPAALRKVRIDIRSTAGLQ